MRIGPERWGGWAIGAVAIGLWAARVLPELGPGPPDGLYNSDSAIPVLMSNLATGAPLDWLYWGQDRFGAWPFLLARVLAWPFGAAWTPHRLHVFQALLWLSALYPWARLAGRGWILASVAFLVLPGANPILRRTLVDVGHVDAWQLAPLFWAWWALRCAADSPRPAALLAGASVAAALATTVSLVSVPLLLVLALLEGIRVAAPWRRRAWLFLPLVVGVCVESLIRHRWHVFVLARGWRDVRTPARLDVGHLAENVVGILRTAAGNQALPWLAAALVLGALAAWQLRPGRREPDGAWTAVGAALCTGTILVLLMAVRHVRDNAYAPRYLGVPLAFAILGLGVLADAALRKLFQRRAVPAADRILALGALAALAVLLPAARPDPREELLRPVAAALASRYPGAVLVDAYWHTYAVAALAPPRALVPLPAEGDWNRRPDWVPLLASGRPVLVGNQGPLAEDGAVPPAERIQYGTRLWLVTPDVLVTPPQPEGTGPDRLSLYAPRPPQR
jgi:hypothetical protein